MPSQLCFSLESLEGSWITHDFSGFSNPRIFKLEGDTKHILLLNELEDKTEFYFLEDNNGQIFWRKTMEFKGRQIFTSFTLNSSFLGMVCYIFKF